MERQYLEDLGFGEPKKSEFRLSGRPLIMMLIASSYRSRMNAMQWKPRSVRLMERQRPSDLHKTAIDHGTFLSQDTDCGEARKSDNRVMLAQLGGRGRSGQSWIG